MICRMRGIYDDILILIFDLRAFRLARVVQKGTQYCPERAARMQLRGNSGTAPFKQVYTGILS